MAARWNRLQAVNFILQTVNGGSTVAALDTAGTSEEADAERTLDEFTRMYLAEGLAFNTTKGELFTASGSPLEVSFPAGTLHVECVGPGQYEGEIELVEGKAFIRYLGSATFPGAASIFVDRVFASEFEDCPGDVQAAVLAGAAQLFRQRKKPDPEVDQMLERRFQQMDARVQRPARRTRSKGGYVGPVAAAGGDRN